MIIIVWAAILFAMGALLAWGGCGYHQIENGLRAPRAGLWHRYW